MPAEARRTKPEDLDPAALEKAAAAICALHSEGICPEGGCVNCNNSDEYGFVPEARAAICAYLNAIGAVEVPVLNASEEK